MALSAGESVYYRHISELERYNATIVSCNDNDVALRIHAERLSDIPQGEYLIISDPTSDSEYYTEVTGIEGDIIKLKRMWSERREYFRVDDVFPVMAKKISAALPYKKSRIFSGYSGNAFDPDVPDETISPQLWKMLVDINTKLGLILEKLTMEKEGIINAENKHVNISASGIKFRMSEKVQSGDVIEIKMLLPTYPSVGVLTYGNVVRVNNADNGEYDVALQFSDIDDEVMDEIMQYALKRQREIIRKQKQKRASDVQ